MTQPEVTNVAAPAVSAVTEAAPEPVLPGQPIECDPAAAAPGEIVQLLILDSQFPPGTVIRGLKVGPGLRVNTVIVGRSRFPASEGGRWEDCIGQGVPPQSFLILLVQNMTDEVLVAKATWYVGTGDAAPVPAPPLSAPVAGTAGGFGGTAPQVVPAAPKPAQPLAYAQVAQVTPPRPPPPPVNPATVTPGTNEVAVLLQRSECERLLRFFSGGELVPHHDHPSIIRQLTAALAR